MTAKKLDFSMGTNGRIEAIKVRIYDGLNGAPMARFEGGIFNEWKPNADQLDEAIRVLQDVRAAVGKGVNAKST